MRKRVTDEVQVILNTAASINFDDPIREALQINYFGARRILDLAHECKNIIALHHVSTAFANTNTPNNAVIPEDVMPSVIGENWE